MSAVVHEQRGYDVMDEKTKRLNKLTRGDDTVAHIEEDVTENSTSGNWREKRTITAIPYRSILGRADSIKT